jgi:hypothetical protein
MWRGNYSRKPGFPHGKRRGGKKTYQRTNNSAQVEDTPKPGKVCSLHGLIGIRDHDGALGGPEQTGADTEKDTGEDVEAEHIGVDRDEERDGVDAVSDASKSKSPFDTDLVDKGSAKEAEDGEGTVERRVLRGGLWLARGLLAIKK